MIDSPQADTRDTHNNGFDELSLLAHKTTGLVLSQKKAAMIQSRLRHRLQAVSAKNLRDYCKYVESDRTGIELQNMISALTTNVTDFFREPHHFEILERRILPQLKKKIKNKETIRIWSAGCSKGKEPISIAITLLKSRMGFHPENCKILATDIDQKILKYAADAVYYDNEVDGLDQGDLSDFFDKNTSELGSTVYSAKPELTDLITYKHLNLVGAWPMKKKFDVIFCRNVVIYFDAKTQEKLWTRFWTAMKPESVIFVGHSERIANSNFKIFGATAYQAISQNQN